MIVIYEKFDDESCESIGCVIEDVIKVYPLYNENRLKVIYNRNGKQKEKYIPLNSVCCYRDV